jgi:hypothetical protein
LRTLTKNNDSILLYGVLILLIILVVCCSARISAQTARYYKAQLHCHSTGSDGQLSPLEVANEYQNLGYEILFISDHNKMTPSEDYTIPGLLCINAEELTFSKHINGLFLEHTIDAKDYTAQQAVDSIKAQGGLVSFNHPVKMKYGPDWSYPEDYFDENSQPDFIEIFNASVANFAPVKTEIWDYLLSNDNKIYGIASDDMHKVEETGIMQTIDVGWIMVKLSSLEKDSVYEALKRGDFYSSTGIEITDFNTNGNEIYVSCSNCSKISFIGENGKVLKEEKSKVADYIRTDEKYVRVEIEDNGIAGIGKKKAWTQPVFYDDMTALADNKKASLDMKCYPNPFVSDLNISYTLAEDDNVIIQLYDYTGKEVETLYNQHQQAGDYSMQFDGKELNEGIYYCKLTTTEQTLTNKVVLLR